jgi:Rps23 Pro-64 3,4-dihydroxylase Tpa1-like proline 4-hydroxylase
MFRLHPELDPRPLRAAYRRDGWLHIPQFLAGEAAGELHSRLRTRADWRQVLTTASGGAVELDRPTRAAMNPDQARALDDAVYAQARSGFQYRFETLRVPDSAGERAASEDPLAAFAAWLSAGEARDFLREVTSRPDLTFADAQGTAYAPGDFLTGHDDAIEGKDRRAAYVFGLTPVWRIEWGGLLLFHSSNGHVRSGLSPAFNSLNLFAVPTMHSVSEVTRAAPYRRYSITGWLRSGEQPL